MMRRVVALAPVLWMLALPWRAGAAPLSARQLAEQGRIPEAIAAYQKLLAESPGNVAACAELATVLCNSGRQDRGLTQVQACIQQSPRESRLYQARGLCNQRRGAGGLSFAEADYRRAVELDPSDASAHNELGVILQLQGNNQAAVLEFAAALERDPNLLVAANNRAASLIALGRYPEAITLLQSAIARAPSLQGLFFYTNLGLAFLHAGMPGRAEAAFLMETAINPGHLEAHLNLGNLYVIQERYEDAYYEYQRVLRDDPRNKQALVNLGAVCVIAGDDEEGAGYLQKALAEDPDSALAHHYLGRAYANLDYPERAAAEQERARQLGYRPDRSPFKK